MNMLLMEGLCAPSSESGCDATGTIGSIKCTDDNVNECQTCDIAKDREISIVSNLEIQLDTSSESEFPLNLPANAQTISNNVKEGNSNLKIGSTENSEKVNLGNVSISGKTLTLESLTNAVLNVINLFGYESKVIVYNNANTDAKLQANKVYAQKGSNPE